MNKKIGLSIMGILFLIFPLAASASVLSDLQAQVQSLLSQLAALQQSHGTAVASTTLSNQAMPSFACVHLTRSLSRGSTGADVMSLQSYLGVIQTGYFGPRTESAVAKFQANEGISPLGIVGPRTRAAFARRCGNPPSGSLSAWPLSGDAPLLVNFSFTPQTDASGGSYYVDFGDGQGQVMSTQQIYCIRAPCISPSAASHTYTSTGTYTATVSTYIACLYANPRCMLAQPAPLASVTITVDNRSNTGAPSISGVDGPTSLQAGQSGTWNVHVNDSSGYLSYAVRWGDEGPVPLYSSAASTPAIASSGTFTHAYASAGKYAPSFTVTNGNGQSSSASASVVVGGNTSCHVPVVMILCVQGTHRQDTYDANGCMTTPSCVPDTPPPTLSASPTSGSAPLQIVFTATTGGTVGGQYSIAFGDGAYTSVTFPLCNASSTCAASAMHTYAAAGTYTVSLQRQLALADGGTPVLKAIATVTIVVH